MSDVRKFMLEPWTLEVISSGDILASQRLVPGIYADHDDAYDQDDRHARRHIIVWGTSKENQMCCPVRFDARDNTVPGDTMRDVNQLDRRATWIFLWPLENTDKLPGKAGPTVADYIARVEAGGDA